MSKRSEAKDNHIHFTLKNWARYQNAEWQDGPRQNGVPASWQKQVVNERDANLPDPPIYTDEEDARRTERAMVRCKKRDIETALLLTFHYRDDLYVPRLKRLRGKFWIFM